MPMRRVMILFIALMPAAVGFGEAQSVSASRVRDLQKLHWGMFVCWSLSTFSGREWTPGVNDIGLFHPTGCDTDQWVRTAKAAGMGYILFLTKHHDGFCLWDTQTTDRKVTKSVLRRDVLRELRRSCDKRGMKLALYFSEGEWAWTDKPDGTRYQSNGGYNPELKKAQLRELLTHYGPIEFIWFDNAVGDGGLSHAETVDFCKRLQPKCFVGFNGGAPAGDIRLGEMGYPSTLDAVGYNGYRLAEFTYPILRGRDGGAMWFYSLAEHDRPGLRAEKLYWDYLGAKRYGNIFSLDFGPDYAGKLRKVDVATVAKVAKYIVGKLKLPPPPISQGKTAHASSTWRSSPGFDASKAVDGDESTRWGAAEDSRSGWLEIDLGKPVRISRAVVDEGTWDRVRRYELRARVGNRWVRLAAGTTLGPWKSLAFPPIRARLFRLGILEAVDVPTIVEFQLYASRK